MNWFIKETLLLSLTSFSWEICVLCGLWLGGVRESATGGWAGGKEMALATERISLN